ncbi:unnamed protein product [Symbiodinium natans]|uniref:Uncharacterized protein n=1 Tax=Symbiodinium natans TaxID=878477 RepID=A0A812J8I1_9DINO|nr:unnamed protein product [Symbiodinium natans]
MTQTIPTLPPAAGPCPPSENGCGIYARLDGDPEAGNREEWPKGHTTWCVVKSYICFLCMMVLCFWMGRKVAPLSRGEMDSFPLWAGEASLEDRKCVFNIFLARHCNKNPPWAKDPTRMQLCTETGFLRGEHMAAVFGPGGKFPVPDRLFARHLAPGFYSSRDLYLLWPLAQRLKLVVNTTFKQEDPLQLVRALHEGREASCGSGVSEQTVLVSWDHCTIPALAQALGCNDQICRSCWDDAEYDRVIWLRYAGLRQPSHKNMSWNMTARAVAENYSSPRGAMGYKECLGNPVENQRFGYTCQAPPSWDSLPTFVTGPEERSSPRS